MRDAAAVAVDCAAAVFEIKDMPGSKRYSFFLLVQASACLLSFLLCRLQATTTKVTRVTVITATPTEANNGTKSNNVCVRVRAKVK